MKKLLKKIDVKAFVIIIGLIIFEAIIFFLTKPFLQEPLVLGSALDDKIPFIPHFIWIYVFWYFMLFAVPYYLAKKDSYCFCKYIMTYIITTVISGIIFVAFPNTVVRANIQGTDIASTLVKIIYFLDTPNINCFPSIHCLYSFLFIFGIFNIKGEVPSWIKTIITILSILVVFSTLFIKQHVIYDAIGSFVIGIVVWVIVDKFKLYNNIHKLLYKNTNYENTKINTQVA